MKKTAIASHTSHLHLLWGWPVYFLLHFLTENLIPAENCTQVHLWLDDCIPFCEWFLIPYVGWYGLILFSLCWFWRFDRNSFRNLQIYFILVQLSATVIYILLPSRQDLRPAVFSRDNLLTRCVAFLYRVDTNTGVCPSLHVACSLGIASVWHKRRIPWLGKCLIHFATVLICLSTVFLKQHSTADFFAALPLCLLVEGLIFGKSFWLPKIKKAGLSAVWMPFKRSIH